MAQKKIEEIVEENLLELDINKEDLDKDLEQFNVKLDESNTEFKQETSGLFKKQEKAEKQIAILAPRRTRLLKKIPKNILTENFSHFLRNFLCFWVKINNI